MTKNQKQYAVRDHMALGEHYVRHVSAMTGEGLHSKSAIAAELAWRDAEIATLRQAAGKAPNWGHCATHGPGHISAWGCPECVREMRAALATKGASPPPAALAVVATVQSLTPEKIDEIYRALLAPVEHWTLARAIERACAGAWGVKLAAANEEQK